MFVLATNNLRGAIPQCLDNMSYNLEILDMHHNNLLGTLRTTFRIGSSRENSTIFGQLHRVAGNLPTSLRTIDPSEKAPSDNRDGYYQDSVVVATKEISQGHIPPSLGSLSSVESLDLSGNHLVGEIPAQFASLTSLEVMMDYVDSQFQKVVEVAECQETDNTAHVLDEESSSTFLGDFIQGILMGYGTGLIIGFSIAYFLLSRRNSNWLSRIYEELEHRVYMRRRKKQRDRQRHNRR
ncbi:hypothetical protein T459_31339 [Capsicum annuum]|uniref:Receptor-like protein 12 n=1 Tax=Capsicum annuum TaxID=4072 RepID=A0A2G2YB21_CAPAN|nr:hypothetical protein T459_31339 [Capsicum annuum]